MKKTLYAQGDKMLYENMIIDGMYQIINEIGSGGMGIVYLAYHLRLQKYVVLKQIKNPYADTSMLRNEVDILKGLHHPYLPQVYDFVEFEGNIYTVIDYIDGCDFNYYINNGQFFSESQLIKWLRQLCEVLAYLHSRTPQILHTDIKPGNIIVTTSGDICLIDFGISVYNTDTIKGLSENYSSPEQYENFYYLQYGEGCYVDLDERTDIYSLGATFYHIMTGYRPDVKDWDQAPVTEFSLPYSDALLSIIDKAMQRDREKRFRGAPVMLKAIDNIKKQDVRYKKYLLLQVAASVVAAVMIVSGIVLIANGHNQEVKQSFTKEYSEFIKLSDSGDNSKAASAGMELLNNNRYSSVLNDTVRSQIAHKIGDSYYFDEDYYNAVHYYKQAVTFENNELYSRDIIIALIRDGREDEAISEMEGLKAAYPSSAVIAVADAQLYYERGEYAKAIDTVDANYPAFPSDTENLYSLSIIKGDALYALGKFSEAANEYGAAREKKETAFILRKQGDAYLRSAMSSGNNADNKNAYSCYEILRNRYSLNKEDAINYAQCAIATENTAVYEDCKKTLNDLSQINEDCRLYIVLAELADITEDPSVGKYCEKAHDKYKSLSDEDKGYISSDSLSAIQDLYKEHCGSDW